LVGVGVGGVVVFSGFYLICVVLGVVGYGVWGDIGGGWVVEGDGEVWWV